MCHLEMLRAEGTGSLKVKALGLEVDLKLGMHGHQL